MKPTNDLFNLIKSLSSNEKRYFKLFAVSVGGKENSTYMRLFNAIDAMDEYDEALLKEKFRNEAFVRQLSVAKNYLYHVILKSLVQSNAENTLQVRLALQVIQAEILLEKGLLDQCSKFIGLLKKDLKRVEDFHLLDKLIDLEGRIHLKRFEFSKIFNNYEEQRRELRKRNYASELKKKAIEIYAYNQSTANLLTDADKKKLHEIVASLFDNPPPDDIGTAGKFYYYTCLNFYYGALKDPKNRLKYAREVMDLLHRNPDFVEMNPRLYYSATSNLCQALLGINDYKKVEQLLHETKNKNIEAGAGIKKEIQNEVMAGVLNAEMFLHINNREFHKAVALEEDVREVMGNDKMKVGNFYFFELNFNLAHAHFMNGNHQRALDYLENILRDTGNEQRKDLHLASRIFEVLLHYEAGSRKLIQNIADTTLRYLKRHDCLTEFDAQLIQFLKKKPDEQSANQWLRLKKLLEASELRRISLLAGYIDIQRWIEKQIELGGKR